MNPIDDPVVEETRAVRRELADRFGNSIDALCDFLAERELKHEQLLVSRPPKPPQVVAASDTVRKEHG
jgi:hypothetical protein